MKTRTHLSSIKQAGFAVLCLLISGLSFSQSTGNSPSGDFDPPGSEFQGVESVFGNWPSSSVSLNAAGFLVMGPIFQIDFRIAEKTYLGAYYVNHSMGLFAGTIIFDSDITAHSPKSMGVGITAKHYFKQNLSTNAWYIGLYLGYSYNEGIYHSGYPNERVERLNDIIAFASGGYRWNLGENFYVLTGLQLGFAKTFSDDIYSSYTLDPGTGTYIKEESYYMAWPNDIYPYLLPELTIGINLKFNSL